MEAAARGQQQCSQDDDLLVGYAVETSKKRRTDSKLSGSTQTPTSCNLLGDVGEWIASCVGLKGVASDETATPALSFRSDTFSSTEIGLLSWREIAHAKFIDALLLPELSALRDAATGSMQVKRVYELDGVRIEELSWQLPYGPRTQALLMMPATYSRSAGSGSLPAVMALHCHGGQKFFGIEKITKTDAAQHIAMVEHQKSYYGGRAWANALAKRGYAVLVHDAFPFGSRRVLQSTVASSIKESCVPTEFQEEARQAAAQRKAKLVDSTSATLETAEIEEYNRWASEHEHVIAKSLLSAGLSWPGLLLAEDIAALDILLNRPEVDPTRVACGGLSGGGLRTMLLGAADRRISCTVQVGYFTTLQDMVLQKSYGHSWQGHIPSLARELDMPDLVAMRCPLPCMVQQTRDDPLFTLQAAEQGLGHVQESFTKAGFADHFVGTVYDGPHKFDLDMQKEAFEWLDKWLLPKGAETLLGTLRKKVEAGVVSELQRLKHSRADLDRRISELQKASRKI